MTERAPVVVAITGASGAPYAVRLLEALVRAEERVWLMISSHGWRLLQMESGIGSLQELRERTHAAGWDEYVTLYDAEDRGAAPASGSARTRGMVICPCSMGTLAALAAGTSRSLVERAGDVTLKERRPLILVARETPLSRDPSREHAAPHARGRGRAPRRRQDSTIVRAAFPISSISWSRACSITSESSTRSASVGARSPMAKADESTSSG